MQINITEIFCVNSSAPIADNFFMLIQADGLPPTRYPPIGTKLGRAGHSVQLPSTTSSPPSPTNGLVVPFDYGVVMTAFDRDYKVLTSVLNDNDFLFSFSVNAESNGNTFTSTNHNGASYKITYNITD